MTSLLRAYARPLSLVASVLGALLVQVSIFGHLPLMGAQPDVVLLVVVSASLNQGPAVGLALGLGAGLLVDLAGGYLVGLGALTKLLIGYGAGLTGERLYRENLIVPAAVVFAASVLDQAAYLLVANAFGQQLDWDWGLRRVVLPTAWYNLLLVPFVYPWFVRLSAYLRKEVAIRVGERP